MTDNKKAAGNGLSQAAQYQYTQLYSTEAANQSNCNKKLPPFGKPLSTMHQNNNAPFIVMVCYGHDSFNRARHFQKNPQVWALVMPDCTEPASYEWMVDGIYVVIMWNHGPGAIQVMKLVKVLLKSGAAHVTVRPEWIDVKEPAVVYDSSKSIDQRWIQIRERIVTYPGLGGNNVYA